MANSTLIFKKVKETSRQRFYTLSEEVFKVPNPNYNLSEETGYTIKRLNDKYKHLKEEVKKGIRYVCVSDAHTHTERLVFRAALDVKTGDVINLCGHQIDGKHTMMIHGGSERHVHPDEVYLRRLASVNGFDFETEVSNG